MTRDHKVYVFSDGGQDRLFVALDPGNYALVPEPVPVDRLPSWLPDRIAALCMVPEGDRVPGLGRWFESILGWDAAYTVFISRQEESELRAMIESESE